MRVIALQSGSNGNCIYIEAGDVRLLVDAGISGTRAQERLAQYGRDVSEVDALLISHDHWLRQRGDIWGYSSRATVIKNKLAAPDKSAHVRFTFNSDEVKAT